MTDPIHLIVTLTPAGDHSLTTSEAQRLVEEVLGDPAASGGPDVAVTADLRLSVLQGLVRQAGGQLAAQVEPAGTGWVPLSDHPAARWLVHWLAQLVRDGDGIDEVEAALRGWLAQRDAVGLDPTPTGKPPTHTVDADGAASGDGPAARPDDESTCCCEEATELRERIVALNEDLDEERTRAAELVNERDTARARVAELEQQLHDTRQALGDYAIGAGEMPVRDQQVIAAALRWIATYVGGSALAVLAEQVADADPSTADLMAYVSRALSTAADGAGHDAEGAA